MNIFFGRWSMVVKLYIVHLYIVHTSYIVHRSFVHPASLFDAGILLDRFGGDSSGGLGTVGGLNVRRRGGDRAPCFARRHAEGNGAARQERKDDRLNDFVNLLVAHRFQCMWVRYVVVPARGCWSVGCKGHGRSRGYSLWSVPAAYRSGSGCRFCRALGRGREGAV